MYIWTARQRDSLKVSFYVIFVKCNISETYNIRTRSGPYWELNGKKLPSGASLLPDVTEIRMGTSRVTAARHRGSSVWMFSSDNGRKVVSCGSFKWGREDPTLFWCVLCKQLWGRACLCVLCNKAWLTALCLLSLLYS